MLSPMSRTLVSRLFMREVDSSELQYSPCTACTADKMASKVRLFRLEEIEVMLLLCPARCHDKLIPLVCTVLLQHRHSDYE